MVKTKRKFHNYTEQDMQNVLEAIKNGSKIRAACSKFGVPRTSVQDRLSGRVSQKQRKMGPDPYLTQQNEDRIVKWILEIAKCGFSIKKNELLDTVQRIVKDDNINTPFKDGRPGQTWHAGFLKRHSKLSIRTAEIVDKSRAKLTEQFIRAWFKDLQFYLTDVKAIDILKDPTRILHASEIGFQLCPKTGKILGPRGYKYSTEVKHENPKENLTALITFTADGRICPPFIIFPFVKPPQTLVQSMPATWILEKSEYGLMSSEVFYKFVANGLNKWLNQQQIKRPVVFFINGHRSHMSLALSEFCNHHNIILYALPPNAAHVLHPADVSVFKPFKEYWRQAVRDWQNTCNSRTVTKTEFCPIFKEALYHEKMPENIRKGFEISGLFPFNPDVVDYSKCIQKRLEKLNESDRAENILEYSEVATAIKVISTMNDTLSGQGIDVNHLLDLLESLQEEILDGNASKNLTDNDACL